MDIYSFTEESKPFDVDDLNEMVYNFMEMNTSLNSINKYTIYIPSKNRPNTVKVTDILQGLNYLLVVEPQDYEAYCKVYPVEKILQMDKNNQGIAYVRNFIKQHSNAVGETKHWQIDDDIEYFKIRKKGSDKNIKVDAIFALSIVEHCTDIFSNVAISGINSDTFAFSRTRAVQKNKLTCQCVLVDNLINNDWAYNGAEDWHYTLSVLEKDYCTLAFDHLMTYSPPPGKNPGGNADIHYIETVLKSLLENFVQQWPARFLIKEEPTSNKKWRLKPSRKFFSDYKQNLILKNNVSTIL